MKETRGLIRSVKKLHNTFSVINLSPVLFSTNVFNTYGVTFEMFSSVDFPIATAFKK